MRNQRGMTLSKLLVSVIVIAVLALMAMRVVPAYIEYFKIVNAVKATAADFADGKEATVETVRKAFDRRAGIDDIKDIKSEDLDITKEGDKVVVEFEYMKKAPLFANVSLLFEFKGSSRR